MEVRRLTTELGYDENSALMISTAVSELARNILKYAGKGEITIETVDTDSRFGIEVIARDRGPGIPDVEQAITDHYSSGGTLGLGLPGVRRMMDEFEVSSEPDVGTQVVVRKWLI